MVVYVCSYCYYFKLGHFTLITVQIQTVTMLILLLYNYCCNLWLSISYCCYFKFTVYKLISDRLPAQFSGVLFVHGGLLSALTLRQIQQLGPGSDGGRRSITNDHGALKVSKTGEYEDKMLSLRGIL